MKQSERLFNIAKIYDDLEHAVRYFNCENSNSIRDKISHKQFLAVFSGLDFDFDFFKNSRPFALDIGCSSGRYTKGLQDRGMYAIGTDAAIVPLKYAFERIDAKFVRASATDLPFKKESFDLIICIELLHHFEDDVLEKVFKEVSEIVKPEGIFIFDIKNKLNPMLRYKYKKEDSIEFTLKARTTSWMIRLAEKHGFETIKKKSILFPVSLFAPYLIIFTRKIR